MNEDCKEQLTAIMGCNAYKDEWKQWSWYFLDKAAKQNGGGEA